MIARIAAPTIDASAMRREQERMLASPTGLARPVVILAGWRAPRLAVDLLAARLRRFTGAVGAADMITVAFPFCSTIDRAVERAVEAVSSALPGDHGGPSEVDAIGVSMGGLVARAAAAPATARRLRRRLRVRRLFTLASPHRGARLADMFAPDAAARAMRPGSEFLRWLDGALPCADYTLVCYAREGDRWVGTENAAPPATPLIRVPRSLLSHMTITRDPLITLDLARRLRGEPPLLQPGVLSSG
jgi:pimeloyl-ACP methyl ester carboxylesterase